MKAQTLKKQSKITIVSVVALVATAIITPFILRASAVIATDSHSAKLAAIPSFPPLAESKAFEQYLKRPQNELSKLLYLVDRFGDTDIEILYENTYYKAPLVSRTVRFFLAIHYKGETAEHWIKQWCTTSIPSGKPVWAKLPDGSFKLARELFLEELDSLAKAIQKNDPSAH
ncbi:MAG: hypothetical protein HY582_02855 [Candidatus Omnitrophica bacterium]|nr:hypothetical protein [Candidatus Omnitrophota bacterium]